MGNGTCAALLAVPQQWDFCPQLPPAYVFFLLFVLTTLFHVYQAIRTRKFYCTVIIISGILQIGTYAFRVISIKKPAESLPFTLTQVLILVAPLWTNAFCYMIMGRMVWNFSATAKVKGITAWRFGLYFVMLDILAFLVQLFGALMLTGNNKTHQQIMNGLHIYMGGVGFQQVCICVFAFFAYSFHRELVRENKKEDIKLPLRMLYTLYVVLILVSVRIVFRLIEYWNGDKSTIPTHEAYEYALDTVPMFAALVLLNIVHPGVIMPGKESNIPGRKERKAGHITKSEAGSTLLPSGTELGSYARVDDERTHPNQNSAYEPYAQQGIYQQTAYNSSQPGVYNPMADPRRGDGYV